MDRPPNTLCFAPPDSLPATQGQRSAGRRSARWMGEPVGEPAVRKAIHDAVATFSAPGGEDPL